MGVSGTIFVEDTQDGLDNFGRGSPCEPAPSPESLATTSAPAGPAPLAASLAERQERRRLAGYAFDASSALPGDARTEHRHHPRGNSRRVVRRFRSPERIDRLLNQTNPERMRSRDDLTAIFDESLFEGQGISRRRTDQVDAERTGDC